MSRQNRKIKCWRGVTRFYWPLKKVEESLNLCQQQRPTQLTASQLTENRNRSDAPDRGARKERESGVNELIMFILPLLTESHELSY